MRNRLRPGRLLALAFVLAGLAESRPANAALIPLLGAAGFPNGRTSNDPPANAIDQNTSTFTWVTESFNTSIPSHLAVDFASTAVNRLRLWKNDNGGGGLNIKDLEIQYTTDNGLLSSRTWTTVSSLENGFEGTELMNATSVNANGTVTGDVHNSLGADGYASLSFATVTATGLRISFRNPPPSTGFNHYRVGELEVWFDGCTDDSDCIDSVLCNGTESCDTMTGECLPGTPVVCTDNDACNGLETCSPADGSCLPGTPVSCTDGDACNGLETCVPADGSCLPGTPVSCSDADACNGLETCVPADGSCLPGTPVSCTDGDACNGLETCVPADGSCLPGTPVSCTDADVCNGVETCVPADGSCLPGTPLTCGDADPCTQNGCNGLTGCVYDATPATTCANDTPNKMSLILHSDTDPSKNKVQFKWLKGSFPASDFGTPLSDTDYTLCVYDSNGPVVGLAIPAAAMCSGSPCWSLTGANDSGIKFKDLIKPPTFDGVAKITGKSDTAGKAKLLLKAQGTNVPTFSLGSGLSYPVTAQVVTSDAGCWEVSFTAPDEKKNDGTTFKGSHKTP